MVKNEDYRETLIELVRATGQELIDRAPDLVGENVNGLDSFSIYIHYPTELDSLPTIDVNKSFTSKNSLHIVLDAHK
jgi:hypothetical protein